MVSIARDIPKATKPSQDKFTAGATRSVLATRRFDPLPTPPNSVSTSLPKCVNKSYETHASATQLGLEDAEGVEAQSNTQNRVEAVRKTEKSNDQSRYPYSDTIGDITPALLAQHYLPKILLKQGPLAIRHIMGLLTIAVPGFSRIPSTKARRLVVHALETRLGTDQSGTAGGHIIYEKVGWGRWQARSPDCSASQINGNQTTCSQGSSLSADTIRIADLEPWKCDRTRLNTPDSTWTNDSSLFPHGSEMDLHVDGVKAAPNEVDKMSIDGDEVCSASESEDEEIMSDDSGDITDDEDWAAVGAAALRAASYSTSHRQNNFITSFANVRKSSYSSGPCVSTKAGSDRKRSLANTDISSFHMYSHSLEREAVEALLCLSSV